MWETLSSSKYALTSPHAETLLSQTSRVTSVNIERCYFQRTFFNIARGAIRICSSDIHVKQNVNEHIYLKILGISTTMKFVINLFLDVVIYLQAICFK